MTVATKPKPKLKPIPKAASAVVLDPFRVKPFPNQPRKRFRGIDKLAESIRLVGQVTPIVVTLTDAEGFDAELVDGERRLQACRSSNMPIKAIVEGNVSDDERFALSIAANFCRQSHDCVEIAEACEHLREQGKTYAEIAAIFGKTLSFVAQHLSLLKLHPRVQDLLKRAGDEAKESRREIRGRGRMTLSVALLLVPLPPVEQVKAAKRIVKMKMSLAASRSFVWGLGKKHGFMPRKKQSPHQKFQALWNQTDTYRHAVERYATLRWSDWQPVLDAVSPREAMTLMHQLRALAEDIAGIADTLEKAVEK